VGSAIQSPHARAPTFFSHRAMGPTFTGASTSSRAPDEETAVVVTTTVARAGHPAGGSLPLQIAGIEPLAWSPLHSRQNLDHRLGSWASNWVKKTALPGEWYTSAPRLSSGKLSARSSTGCCGGFTEARRERLKSLWGRSWARPRRIPRRWQYGCKSTAEEQLQISCAIITGEGSLANFHS
jgi:hypothetical protein